VRVSEQVRNNERRLLPNYVCPNHYAGLLVTWNVEFKVSQSLILYLFLEIIFSIKIQASPAARILRIDKGATFSLVLLMTVLILDRLNHTESLQLRQRWTLMRR
jgi:hypothetical protein